MDSVKYRTPLNVSTNPLNCESYRECATIDTNLANPQKAVGRCNYAENILDFFILFSFMLPLRQDCV